MKIKSFFAAFITFFLFIFYPQFSFAGWQQLPGSATDIGAGGGSVWVTGTTREDNGYTIYRWNHGNWQRVDGSAVAISVDSNGQPWVVNQQGDIFYRDSSWHKLPGSARDIGVGGRDNSVWVIGSERTSGGYQIFHWNGAGWDKVDGGGVRIAVDNHGKPWVVNDRGEIFRMAGHHWEKMPGAATDIAIGGDDSVWVIGTDGRQHGYGIHHWVYNSWQRVDGDAVRIAVAQSGKPWVVNGEGTVYKYSN